jgi:hypothetical protein
MIACLSRAGHRNGHTTAPSETTRIHEAPIGLQLHSNQVAQEVRFKNLVLETFPEDRLITVGEGK